MLNWRTWRNIQPTSFQRKKAIAECVRVARIPQRFPPRYLASSNPPFPRCLTFCGLTLVIVGGVVESFDIEIPINLSGASETSAGTEVVGFRFRELGGILLAHCCCGSLAWLPGLAVGI